MDESLNVPFHKIKKGVWFVADPSDGCVTIMTLSN